jgi:predicted MPP superfamily phosphohydrolase
MRGRLVWLVLILTILFGGSTYIALRLSANAAHVALVAFLAFLPASFFFLPRRTRREPTTRFGKLVQQAGFASLGLLSWLCVVALARDVALFCLYAFATAGTAQRFEEATVGLPAFLLAAAIAALGTWRALRGPTVRSVTVPVDGLPEALSGFRIVQISDLHVGPTIGPRYVARLVGLVRDLAPDLTALTGDIFDGTVADLELSVKPLADLVPRGRVFYVPGNHEYYHSFATWTPELERLGFRTLLNRGERVDHGGHALWIGGVTDPAGPPPDPAKAALGSDGAVFRILLSHRPGYAEPAARAGFQLQLSGHTHGGQFFPWTYVVRLFHRYFVGLLRHENMWIYVSPGTGTWGPPIRLGTTPEVTCLRLEARSA